MNSKTWYITLCHYLYNKSQTRCRSSLQKAKYILTASVRDFKRLSSSQVLLINALDNYIRKCEHLINADVLVVCRSGAFQCGLKHYQGGKTPETILKKESLVPVW